MGDPQAIHGAAMAGEVHYRVNGAEGVCFSGLKAINGSAAIGPVEVVGVSRYKAAMRKAALLGTLLLASCEPTALKAVDCAAMVADEAIIERCFGGDINGQYVGDEECFPFSEEREYEGLLITGFEWSEFYPSITDYEKADRQNPVFWFEEAPGSFGDNAKDQKKCTDDCAFRVSFVGRESLCDAYFGHLGSYPKKVIAKRRGQRRQLDLSKD